MGERKKAIIITIYDPYPNMGNRLQNYAVQNILEKNDIEVMTLSFLKPVFTNKQKLKHHVHKLTGYKYSRDESYWKLLPKQIHFCIKV